ncbi:MAG: nicotinamide riboside transporter PnuC, partial [Lachnospiraceae bacterium]|nr:nicotinamide riboside transporter PnuC [Lachnospiraceae bacterium]
MEKIKAVKKYFSLFEIGLWVVSVTLITLSFLIFDGENYLTLFASLIGVTAILLNAKGNPIGQFLMILFSFVYG